MTAICTRLAGNGSASMANQLVRSHSTMVAGTLRRCMDLMLISLALRRRLTPTTIWSALLRWSKAMAPPENGHMTALEQLASTPWETKATQFKINWVKSSRAYQLQLTAERYQLLLAMNRLGYFTQSRTRMGMLRGPCTI